ncbi:MAG: Gfo/Idh/MocA family oxidoreductase [Clostridia bacterium]
MKTIGYAIVGTGYFGAELGRIISKEEGTRIVAVLDPENGEAIAKELSCEAETDLDTLCARPDVDAVLVATPNYLHKEPVLAAARHQKHVFCEKPIALHYADCEEMVRTAEQNHVIFMAGHVMNFFSGVRTAKRMIQEGRIGQVLYCHAARNGWEPPQPSISWKKIREKSGGHLYHHIHELDCIQFIMGPAKRVTMVGGNIAHQGKQYGDEDDMLFLMLEFENGTNAVLEYGSAFRWSEHYLLIQGTLGAIRIDMKDVGGTLRTAAGEEHFLVHETQEEDDDRTHIYNGALELDGAVMYGKPGRKPPLWLHGIMQNEMHYFNAIMHGQTASEEFVPLLNGSAAKAAIATTDAATLSLRENRKVDVCEITGAPSAHS